MPIWILILVACLGLVVACFRAWRDQRRLTENTKMELEAFKASSVAEILELTEKTKPLVIEDVVVPRRSDFELQYHYCVKIFNPSKATPADHLKLELISLEQIPIPKQDFKPICFPIALPLRLPPAPGSDLMINPTDSALYILFRISIDAIGQLDIDFPQDGQWHRYSISTLSQILGMAEMKSPTLEFILILSVSADMRQRTFQKFKMTVLLTELSGAVYEAIRFEKM